MDNTFAERLKHIRTERGWTQEQLAKVLGTSKQVISRYETGQRVPKLTVASSYAEILGVDFNYFISGVYKENELPANQKDPSTIGFDDFSYALHNESGDLTEEDKALLLQMARQLAEKNKNGGKTR